MVGVAINVTKVPAQIVLLGLTEMLTNGDTGVVTVTVIIFEVTDVGAAQVALLVNIHVMILPFTNPEFWY